MRKLFIFITINLFFSCYNIDKPTSSLPANDAIYQDTMLPLRQSLNAIYLETYNANNLLSTATGFFVNYKDTSYFVTNWHVITGLETDNSIKDSKGRVVDNLKLFLLSKDGQKFEVKLPTRNTLYWYNYIGSDNKPFDIAICKLDLPPNSDWYKNSLSIVNLKDGDSCFEIGFPKSIVKDSNNDYSKKTDAKIISTYKGQQINLNLSLNYPEKIHSEILENGSSGSPVYNIRNELIGIHVTAACTKHIIEVNKEDCIGSVFLTNEAIIKVIEQGKAIIWKK